MKKYIATLFILCSCYCFSQKNGPYEKFYENGKLKTSGHYKNKKRVGEWKSYYATGELSSVYSYTNGKKDKETISYFKNGKVKYEVKKSDKVFIAKSFYESGKLFYERVMKNGYYKEFLENGLLKIKSNYTNNQLSGIWTRFYETGKPEWEITFIDGYKEGSYKHYYPNGQLKIEGVCKGDKREGKELHYNEDREVINEIKYKKGKHKNASFSPVVLPDGVIERVPVYPGCEKKSSNDSRRKCMSESISEFISKNFNTSFASDLGLEGRQKIFVIFKIDKTGRAIDIKARAPHPKLEKEAINIISKLPVMKPAEQRGKIVNVPYSLPIVFMVRTKKNEN